MASLQSSKLAIALSRRRVNRHLGQIALAGFAAAGLSCSVAGSAAAHHSPKAQSRNHIRRMLIREAAKLNIDPALALAIAHTESYFNPRAESHVGARGVMQIMPATCRGEYALHPDALWEAQINIRMGLHFMSRLLQRYQNHEHFALSYYNGGSRVGNLPNAKVIPATRKYVKKVSGLKARYRDELAQHGGQAWQA